MRFILNSQDPSTVIYLALPAWGTLGDSVTIWQWIKFSPWSGVSGSYLPNSVWLAFNAPSTVFDLSALYLVTLATSELKEFLARARGGAIRIMKIVIRNGKHWVCEGLSVKKRILNPIICLLIPLYPQRSWCWTRTGSLHTAGTKTTTSPCSLCSRPRSHVTSSIVWTPRMHRDTSGSSSPGHLTNHQYVRRSMPRSHKKRIKYCWKHYYWQTCDYNQAQSHR